MPSVSQSPSRPAAQRPAPKELLQLDSAVFAEKFDEEPFIVGHALSDHPLFDIERLMELSMALPEKCVEFNAGDLPIGCDPTQTPRNGLSAQETIRRIRDCKSWMVLKYVEQDPAYRRLLDDCLAEVAALSEPLCPGMCSAEAFIFLSSPGAVTPYHMDPEHNFLLQIRGQKFMTVFERSVVSSEELERFYGGAHRNMAFSENYLEKSQTFELNPGIGLHVPVTAPHFVRVGSEVSVSFSITFRTPDLDKRSLLHNVNALMRKRGLSPAPAGNRPRIDAAKITFARAARRILGDKFSASG
jgi:hypothetical protein